MNGPDDHYAILGVSSDATTEEIREAWRFTLQAFHPDKFRDESQRDRAEEITKRANAAWEVLQDDASRGRYDHIRASSTTTASYSAPPKRSIPCPSCATPSQIEDQQGETVELICPACRMKFASMVGAICVLRPTLERRGWLRLHYVVGFRTRRGEQSVIYFRSFPKELALSQGERFSVVFDPAKGRPVYAVNHAPDVDLAWKVS
jgi:curved DNA-binding protein CbpA